MAANMETVLSIIGFVIIILGMTTMYTPWLQLKNCKRLSGKELSITHPEHKWIRWGFISMYLGWIVSIFMLFLKVLSWVNFASFLAGLFASIGLFIGLFAVVTGVSILPTRTPWLLYVVGDEARKSGRFQVTCSLFVLFAAFAFEIIY